jgi:poly-gamma-glutamate synthesis protein (capsule biosynthesis protein)
MADSLKANFIIAFMHWGNEYELVPNVEQQNLAMFLSKQGVDLIIGSHPHVVQTFEILHPDSADSTKVVPVFYSLGNYISNQRDRHRDGGAMFYFEVEKDKKCRILNYNYIPYWVYKGTLKGKYQYYIIPLAYYNPENITLSDDDKNKLLEFSEDIKQHFPNLPENENIKNLP